MNIWEVIYLWDQQPSFDILFDVVSLYRQPMSATSTYIRIFEFSNLGAVLE